MADAPLVSVVIASARGGPMLAQAVRSALEQTIRDIEVVVVLNRPGLDLSELPEDGRVHLVYEETPGRAFAVNRGAAAARGDWLALLDDDDEFEPDKLERQLASLDSWSGAMASVTNYSRVDSSDGSATGGFSRSSDYAGLLAARTHYLPSTLMIRRNLYTLVGGFNPSYRYADDLDFVLRVARMGDLAFVPDELLRYRIHDHRMSVHARVETWLESARVVSGARRAAVECGDWHVWRASVKGSVKIRRWCATAEMRLADRSWRAGRPAEMLRHVRNALRASPLDVVRLIVSVPIRFERERRRWSGASADPGTTVSP